MIYKFFQQLAEIEKVELLYEANGCFGKRKMTVNDIGEWHCEINEDVSMYKFVINNSIRMNDPTSAGYIEDYKGEIWSIPNGSGVLQNNDVRILLHCISNNMEQGVKLAVKKAEYQYIEPFSIFFGVSVFASKHIHSITIICFQPDGKIYYLEEGKVTQFDVKAFLTDLIFEIKINWVRFPYMDGTWQIHAYLDGQHVIKDYFRLGRKKQNKKILIDCKL